MLTKEQTNVLYKIVNDIRKKNKQQLTLGGFAGTGKSFLIGYLLNFFPNYVACAFTGKAANVLRRRKIPANTIHSLIYEPLKSDDGNVIFILRDHIDCDGFVVDESSMVSEEIYQDLASFGLPMIFVGDHGQLEPVGTNFNLMENPDYCLETIHRNAGEIARFAEWLRKGKSPFSFDGDNSQVNICLSKNVSIENYAEASQVICAYNATRVNVNAKIREHLGYKGIINTGEKIICIQNNKKIGIFNGMQGNVNDLYEKGNKKYLDFMTDQGLYEEIYYDEKQFGQEKSFVEWNENMPNPFDYAPCITCHKGQGDEFDHVHVIEQRCNKWNHRRWSYTAASRARTKLVWELSDY